jgi:hypothetical protein
MMMLHSFFRFVTSLTVHHVRHSQFVASSKHASTRKEEKRKRGKEEKRKRGNAFGEILPIRVVCDVCTFRVMENSHFSLYCSMILVLCILQ